MENRDKPAYPVTLDWSETDKKVFTTTEKPGLSKRELFAMAAMQGLLAGNHGARIGYGKDHLCAASISIADDLLKQLESKPL